MPAPEPKIELIADEASDCGNAENRKEVKVPAAHCKASQHQNRFTF